MSSVPFVSASDLFRTLRDPSILNSQWLFCNRISTTMTRLVILRLVFIYLVTWVQSFEIMFSSSLHLLPLCESVGQVLYAVFKNLPCQESRSIIMTSLLPKLPSSICFVKFMSSPTSTFPLQSLLHTRAKGLHLKYPLCHCLLLRFS